MANKTLEHIHAQIQQLRNATSADYESQWEQIIAQFDELSKTVNHQELLLETATAISDAASSILDVDELLDVSVNLIRNGFEFRHVNIFLLDKHGQWAELRATTNGKPVLKHRRQVNDKTPVGWAVKNHQIHFTQKETESASKEDYAVAAEAAVPLISRGRIMGALVIHFAENYYVTPKNSRLLQHLADQLANTIQHTALFAEADQRLEQLVDLHNINLQIGNALNLESLLGDVARLSTKLINAESCVVRLVDKEQQLFQVYAAHNPPKGMEVDKTEAFGAGLSSKVLQEKQALLIDDYPHHPLGQEYPYPQNGSNPPTSILNVPLNLQNNVIGTIEAHHSKKHQAFNENDLYTLSLLAAQVAVAIENTRLLGDAQNSRRFLKTIIEHIPDPIFIKDKNHIWLEMNEANAGVIGCSEQELIGKSDRDYFSPELTDEFYRRDNKVLESNQIFEYEDKTIWADNQEHIAYTRLIPLPDSAGNPKYLLGITNDITERKAHEAERESFLMETAALYKGSQQISSSLSERQILDALLRQIRLQDPCEIAIYQIQNVQNEPIWAELRANWHKKDEPTYPIGANVFLPDSPLQRLFSTERAIFIENVSTGASLSAAERESFAPTKAKSIAVLPISFIGQKIGVVMVFFTAPTIFKKVTQRFWLAMIDQTGMALSNRRLIQEAAYRAIQMETAAEIARAASSLLNLDALLNSAVALIRDRFDLYYAGAFLNDEDNKWAVLRSGTGAAGRIQLENNYRLKINDETMIGWCIYNKQPRIALDVGKDAIHFQSPHLPNTRSEMALPLIYHNKAIGALTIQSEEQAAFSREDIIFLQTMADQLANAIQNARLFEQAQQEITERRRIEAELRTSETKYRELVENANSIIFRIDTDGRFTFFNEFAQTFFGYSQEEILGKPVLGTVVPESDSSGQDLTQLVNNIITIPEEYTNYENENMKANGSRVWVSWANKAITDDHGNVTEILCIGNDVTERKHAEEALVKWTAELEETTTFLDSIVENLPSGIFIKDAQDLSYVRFNRIHQQWTGRSTEDTIGKSDQDLFGEELAEIFIEQDQTVLSSKTLLDIPEEVLFGKGGKDRILHTKKVPILGPDGKPTYLLGISEDITERKHAEEGLLRALERTESLYRIGNAMATAKNQQTIFETVLAEYLRLLNIKPANGSIILFEHTKDYSKVHTLLVNGTPTISNLSFSANQDLVGKHLIKTPAPLIIEDVLSHPLTKNSPNFWQQDENVRSLLFIPMMMRDNAAGTIAVGSIDKGHEFLQSDIELGQVVADQLAIWLENRQLLAETQYRTEHLETAAEISRAASSILDIDELITTSVNLIRDHFNFYYVGMFLIDDAQEWAVLRAGTGKAGRIQLARNHRLKVGGESMIGWSIAHRKARIALDVGEEAVHFRNPILPDTHSEMALPLVSRDEALGALTVQSIKRGAFSDEDVTMLQTMADQLANALANARLFESVTLAQQESDNRLNETQALQQLSQNLATTLNVDEILDIFFRACVIELKFEYLMVALVDNHQNQIRAIGGIGISKSHLAQSVQPLDSKDIMADIVRTGETEIITGWDDRFNREVFEQEGHADWVRLFTPVTLRRENIGLVEAGFNKSSQTNISNAQIRLLKAFINQTALAIDNAQRYEASQRRARREAMIKEITTKVRASTNLDTILQTTVKEVGDAISSKRAYIQLVSSQKSNGKSLNPKQMPKGGSGNE